MRAVGSSTDNALAEAFFATLKREILPSQGRPTDAPREPLLGCELALTFPALIEPCEFGLPLWTCSDGG
jgi:transposase InsO family protein